MGPEAFCGSELDPLAEGVPVQPVDPAGHPHVLLRRQAGHEASEVAAFRGVNPEAVGVSEPLDLHPKGLESRREGVANLVVHFMCLQGGHGSSGPPNVFSRASGPRAGPGPGSSRAPAFPAKFPQARGLGSDAPRP